MKKVYLSSFLIAAIWLAGCAAPEKTDTQAENSQAEIMEAGEVDAGDSDMAGKDDQSQDVYLELVDKKEMVPFYSLSFQKVDKETGEKLLFEGNAESADAESMAPDLTVEPSEDLWEFAFWFDGKEEATNTVTLQFWNRGETGKIQVTIDGIVYEENLSGEQGNEIALDQTKVGETGAILEKATLYSNAVVLDLSEVSDTLFQNPFLLTVLQQEESRIAPTRTAYDRNAKTLSLLYIFEEGRPEDKVKLLIPRSGTDSQNPDIEVEIPLV